MGKSIEENVYNWKRSKMFCCDGSGGLIVFILQIQLVHSHEQQEQINTFISSLGP